MIETTSEIQLNGRSKVLSSKKIKGPLLITNDYVFKKVFSFKEILASFLSAYFCFQILENEIEVENPILGPIKINDKISIPDLKLTITINSNVFGRFNVEMQTTSNAYLHKRFQFTTCKLYVEQMSSGQNYSILNKSCGIVIYSVNHFDDNICLHKFALYDKENELEYEDSIEIHSLEILKRDQLLQNKSPEDVERLKPLYKWLKFFDSKTEEDYMEAAQGNAGMENAWNKIQIMSRSDEEREIAEAVDLRKADEIAHFKTGYKKGYQKGEIKGQIKGEINGEKKKEREIVTKMLLKNMPIDDIVDFCNITKEKIKEIQQSL